jgi:hypothetical protein
MRRDYRKLDRLYESHDAGSMQMPPEVLNMTVGDMLKKLEMTDSVDTNNYETIEDAIMSCLDCLVGDGYSSSMSDYSTTGSVEDVTSAGDIPTAEEEGTGEIEEMPTFADVQSGNLYSQEKSNLDGFTF